MLRVVQHYNFNEYLRIPIEIAVQFEAGSWTGSRNELVLFAVD